MYNPFRQLGNHWNKYTVPAWESNLTVKFRIHRAIRNSLFDIADMTDWFFNINRKLAKRTYKVHLFFSNLGYKAPHGSRRKRIYRKIANILLSIEDRLDPAPF